MAKKFNQGEYVPKNPQKCMNTGKITYRSSWEQRIMAYFDTNPMILKWASEYISIPYWNPIKQAKSNYIPDFFIVYIDVRGKERYSLIEVKPSKEALQEKAKSKYDKIALAVNLAKWKEAAKYCKKNGIEFRIVTENEIFRGNHK